MKRRVREAIVVEGRYDKNALRQAVDAVVIETGGFGVFSDREKVELIKRLARARGVIIMTDPDGAGFLIRNRLKGALGGENVKHAYVPDISGKERRKAAPSKEGLLGVEGVGTERILEALVRAGATFEDENAAPAGGGITKADMYELGLSGGPGSRERRMRLVKKLELPARISANGLLEALNALMSLDELRELLLEDAVEADSAEG